MKLYQKLIISVASMLLAVGCSVDDDTTMVTIIPSAPEIKNMIIPDNILPTLRYTIEGRGFFVGDTVVLRSTEANQYTEGDFKTASTANAFKIDFTVPLGCVGEYQFCLLRNKKIYDLETQIVVADRFDLRQVEMRSKDIRACGRITISSIDMMEGDHIVIGQDGAQVMVETEFEDLGVTRNLTFNLPDTFENGNKIDGEIDLSVYRVGLTTFATTATVHQELVYHVGDYIAGGVVFANDEMTLDAYVTTLKYSPQNFQWGPVHHPEMEVGTTKRNFGAGAANTKAIVQKQGNWNNGQYGAKFADDLVVEFEGKTYDDWFIPSYDEAVALFYSFDKINPTLQSHGGDPVGPGTRHFHTSSENSYNYAVFIVWDQNPVTFELGKNWGDGAARPVRVLKYVK